MKTAVRMAEGNPVKPIAPGSPLQAALGKIVATLVEAGAVARPEESGVGSQKSGVCCPGGRDRG